MSPYRTASERFDVEHTLGARWGVTWWKRTVVRVRRAISSREGWVAARRRSEHREWADYQRRLLRYQKEIAATKAEYLALGSCQGHTKMKPLPPPPCPPPRYVLE